MADVEHIDKETAAAALRASAFHVDDPESSNHGRTLVHCFLGSFGADWDLDGALQTLSEASHVAWMDGFAGHDLAVHKDGKLYRFACRWPAEAEDRPSAESLRIKAAQDSFWAERPEVAS